MLISEISGDNVSRFPTKPGRSKVDVPPGYDSFYTKPAGVTSAHIMGIRPDGKHVQVSTTTKEFADILARAYNSGGNSSVDIQPVSMTSAFGSQVERYFEQLDIRFVEKPDTWDYIKNTSSCSERQIHIAVTELEDLPIVNAVDVFQDGVGRSPMGSLKPNHPNTCVVILSNGDKFVAAKGGSTSYYRMWLYVRPSGLRAVK